MYIETGQALFFRFTWEERDSERLNDSPAATQLVCDRAATETPVLIRTPGLFALTTKCKCAPWIPGRMRWLCRSEPVSMQPPSYLKNVQSLGPTVGRPIASFLCTQDLTLFREAWQREKSRCTGSSCHQLSRLAPLPSLTSAVVTVFLHSCREQLDRNRSTEPCLQKCEGNKEHVGTWGNVILRRSLVLPGVLTLEDARYGHTPAPTTLCPTGKWDLPLRRDAFPRLLYTIRWCRPGETFYPFSPKVTSPLVRNGKAILLTTMELMGL